MQRGPSFPKKSVGTYGQRGTERGRPRARYIVTERHPRRLHARVSIGPKKARARFFDSETQVPVASICRYAQRRSRERWRVVASIRRGRVSLVFGCSPRVDRRRCDRAKRVKARVGSSGWGRVSWFGKTVVGCAQEQKTKKTSAKQGGVVEIRGTRAVGARPVTISSIRRGHQGPKEIRAGPFL